jgi:AcrR family transcriptional regulator
VRTGRRRGQRKGDLREQAILDTAWRLLAAKPIGAITVDELAAGAEISRSSFYFYFESRDAVILALAEKTSAELGQIVVGALEHGPLRADGIMALVTGLLGCWRANGPVLRAMDVIAEHDAELRRFWTGIVDPIVDALALAIDADRAAGRAPAGPPASDLMRSLADMYWRASHQASLTPASVEADRRLAGTLTTITMRAIYGRDDA